MKYTALSKEDQLLIAQDRLAGLEADHLRLSLTHTEASQAGDSEETASRLAEIEAKIEAGREAIKTLK